MRYSRDESVVLQGMFNHGATVTITVVRVGDDTEVISAASCSELSNMSGRFFYTFSQTITSKTDYAWIMTDGTEEQYGTVVLGSETDSILSMLKKVLWRSN